MQRELCDYAGEARRAEEGRQRRGRQRRGGGEGRLVLQCLLLWSTWDSPLRPLLAGSCLLHAAALTMLSPALRPSSPGLCMSSLCGESTHSTSSYNEIISFLCFSADCGSWATGRDLTGLRGIVSTISIGIDWKDPIHIQFPITQSGPHGESVGLGPGPGSLLTSCTRRGFT